MSAQKEEGQLQRIEALLSTIAACGNGAAVDAARSLLLEVLGLHRAALSRALELVQRQGDSGRALLHELAGDDLVSSILLLHDLHPIGFARRVENAMTEAAPRIESLGGRLDGHSIEDGVIKVRVSGLELGSVLMAAHMIVEEAVMKHAPDAASISFSGSAAHREPAPAPSPQGLVTLRIPKAAQKRIGQEHEAGDGTQASH